VIKEADEAIRNPEGYFGKACNPGYQSHYTIGNFLGSLERYKSIIIFQKLN